ncbi:MAG: hypothetical protein QNJ55_17470 [Xenococcus sp. MO_188.B8]|nr:hypothetical protein [Xenococcus sp. MO_188.B8]
MPQMKVEKKFFPNRTSKNLHNIVLTSVRTIAVVEFQGFKINIAGGAE